MKFRSLLFPLFLWTGLSAAPFHLDLQKSAVAFEVSHMGFIVVPGVFHRFRGSADWEMGAPAPRSFQITVEAASVDTKLSWRDEALRGAEFFDVAKTPSVTFQSVQVIPTGNNQWTVAGNLTMRGVTLPIAFTLTPAADNPRHLTGRFPVRRLPYGIGTHYAPPFIGADVIMKLDVVWNEGAP